jgi:hypothetical protein
VPCENLHLSPYLQFPIARNLHGGLLFFLLLLLLFRCDDSSFPFWFPGPARDPKLMLDNVGATEPDDGDGNGVKVPKADGSFVKGDAGDATGALVMDGTELGVVLVPHGVGAGLNTTAPNGLLDFGDGEEGVAVVETFGS